MVRRKASWFLAPVMLALAAVFMLLPAPARSAVVIDLNYEFSGALSPSGDPPWLTATFTDIGTDTVSLELSTAGLIGNEFVTEWNFNSILDPSLLDITQDSGPVAGISTDADSFKADGDGYFDISFLFPTGEESRFGADMTASFTIEGLGITADNFDSLSVGGSKGGFRSAAHVQGIGVNAGGSGWIGDKEVPVPEPGTMMLLGSGLIGLAGWGRKKFLG